MQLLQITFKYAVNNGVKIIGLWTWDDAVCKKNEGH